MTDNMFEIETTALAHVACVRQESGILLTDFAAAYSSVNHSWIFDVFNQTELPDFMCRFLRTICYDSTTHVEFATMTRGQFHMARGVRQGCPASGVLFAMTFDPIFRWLQNAVIPRSPSGLYFLQPVQCAYADDFAIVATPFRRLFTALVPAFQAMDSVAGLALNYRKCCGVHNGSEGSEIPLEWLSVHCPDFAKYEGTMIGPEGSIHRWTAPRKKFVQRVLKIKASTKSLVQRLCDTKIYPLSVLRYVGSVSAPDLATLKAEAHALQCTTGGTYNAIHTNLLNVGSVCGLGPDWHPFSQPGDPVSICGVFQHAQNWS